MNKNEEIREISCEVENCVYQREGSCYAGHIKVGNPRAQHESETKCETFECVNSPNC